MSPGQPGPARREAGNVAIGGLGRGARAASAAAGGATEAGRLALRPAAALARIAWHAPLASPARQPVERALAALDEGGRRERESARDTLEAALERALASPRVSELVDRVLASPAYDHLVDRLLETDALWRLVERVAKSPEVMDAITAGSANLAGDVADQVRRRTVVADDLAERVARTLLRRRRPAPAAEATPAAKAGRGET